MSKENLTPIYTLENCNFSAPLNWGISVFWREPTHDDSWLSALSDALKVDGIRMLGHRFPSPAVSQFVVSTTPDVAPVLIVQRVKGRLQHIVRTTSPKAFRGNYAIRGFGKVTRSVIERYVATQLDHHRMADRRVQSRLEQYQVYDADVDLSVAQATSHGRYWYNLHIVLVHQERWFELRDEVLAKLRRMIVDSSRAKGYRLSRASILPDHVHLALGCPIDQSPAEVAPGFLNNLAFVHGMKPVFQMGAFVGTFGEYDQRAVRSETSPNGGKPHCGENSISDAAAGD